MLCKFIKLDSIYGFTSLLCTLQLWNALLNVSNSEQVMSCVEQEWQLQLQLVIKDRIHHPQV